MTPFAVICDAERIGTYENGQFPTQNVTERMQCLSISISERIGTQAVSVQSWCGTYARCAEVMLGREGSMCGISRSHLRTQALGRLLGSHHESLAVSAAVNLWDEFVLVLPGAPCFHFRKRVLERIGT